MEKIKRKFGAELEINIPKVSYKETISSIATSEYKHKRQSGGHGQYGHVLLRVEPQSRGKGFEFASEILAVRTYPQHRQRDSGNALRKPQSQPGRLVGGKTIP